MPIIFDAVINHRVIHAVGHSSKDGVFFTHNAATVAAKVGRAGSLSRQSDGLRVLTLYV